jgi:hypothetical protein
MHGKYQPLIEILTQFHNRKFSLFMGKLLPSIEKMMYFPNFEEKIFLPRNLFRTDEEIICYSREALSFDDISQKKPLNGYHLGTSNDSWLTLLFKQCPAVPGLSGFGRSTVKICILTYVGARIMYCILTIK